MRKTPLTTRQATALAELAANGTSLFVPAALRDYSSYAITVRDASGKEGKSMFMLKSVFNALVSKGALVQINDMSRPHVCLGYRVA